MTARVFLVFLVMSAAACGNDAPSPTSPTSVVSQTQTYVTTVQVAGSRFYSFTASSTGTLTALLASVTSPATGAPLGLPIELSIGVPAGTGCSATQSMVVEPALTAQLTSTLVAGVYCLRIADAGYLREAARVAVRFTYP